MLGISNSDYKGCSRPLGESEEERRGKKFGITEDVKAISGREKEEEEEKEKKVSSLFG